MAELIFYRGSREIAVEPTSDACYLYRIGAGQVTGGNFIDLNDGRRLNSLAENIRDDYSDWIYSLNDMFLTAGLKSRDLSLFFLTDLSCKRSEFFETFDFICSLLLIKEKLTDVELSSARLIGVESGFVKAFRSIFPLTTITVVGLTKAQARPWKRIGSDSLYLMRLIGVMVVNTVIRSKMPHRQISHRAFFSIYPQMFSVDGEEIKYGEFLGENDACIVSILTDGMHQKSSVTNYIKWCSEAYKRGYWVVDGYLRVCDFVSGLFWLVRLWLFFIKQRGKIYIFQNIDISDFIKTELLFSISRVARLCILKGAWLRFLKLNQIHELVYYPFEYPLGRMISFVANSVNPTILRTGFQMGIASKRRLEQFMGTGEGSPKPPFLKHAPLPDRVLAEDEGAADIYRYAGYQNVETMDKIYRYGYLEGVTPRKRKGWLLIAPGLHDGAMMLERLRSEIETHSDNTYLIKPHPRADNEYLAYWSSIRNLRVSTQPIAELLAIVSRVLVTYSSIGVEAKRLGLDVTVIDVPGRVNASPLLDL